MRSARFERATSASGGQRSIQLSYERKNGWEANKPSSVSDMGPPRGGGSFLLDVALAPSPAAYPGLSVLQPSARAAPRPLFGLAPGGVCRAAPVTWNARWSLTPPFHPCLCACAPSAVCSLWHFPSHCCARPLAGTLPCGARTFLDHASVTAIHTASQTIVRRWNYLRGGLQTAAP
jgi:hypothetical protein